MTSRFTRYGDTVIALARNFFPVNVRHEQLLLQGKSN